MEQEREQTSARAKLGALTTLCWPLIVAMTLALLTSREQPKPVHLQAPATVRAEAKGQARGKLMLVIVDGLRQQALDDHMPKTKQLGRSDDAAERPLHTCSGNFTVPCVQTILEGRQSPFAAGLENFTGKPGGAQSVPAIMARAGLNMAMISDFTLDTLYGNLAKASINVELWPGDYLDHDLGTIKQAHKWLDEGGYDVLLVHVVGTDKVAHRQRPGHPKYAAHYAAVDEALDGLYKRLDYTKDHLIVVGDHGHDQKGHHTRDSVVLVKGPRLGGLLNKPGQPERLEQPELAYLLSMAAQVQLSPEYEGRLLGLEPIRHHDSDVRLEQALDQMEQQEIQTLKAQGLEGESLSSLRQAQLKRRAAQPWLALMRHSPLLILYLGWVMLMAGVERGLRWRPRYITLGVGVGAVLAWFMSSWLPPLASGVGAVLMLAALVVACIKGPLKAARRMYILWLAPLVVITIASLLGARWSEFFHSRGGLNWAMVLFFISLAALGALISRAHSGQWTKSLPEAMGALCVLGLPSGVYYYQIGQNITRGFAIGGVVMLLGLLITRRDAIKGWFGGSRRWWALAIFVVGLGLTLWQSAGGWEWHAGIARALKRAHIAWPILIYVVMGLAILSVLGRWRARLVIGALWVVTPLYAVGIGQLKWPMLVSASVAALTTAGWLALTRGAALWREHEPSQDQREGMWLFALWMMGCWALFSGFFIGQVDFNFAFEFLSMLALERDVAIGASIMTLIKYSLPLWPMALLLGALRPARSQTLTKWLMLALHVKIIALLIQLLCGPLFSTQKLYELALSELLFVLSLGVIVLSGSALALVLRPKAQGVGRPSASA